ncbi:MAG: hypothetical protein V1799_18735 [bacterium]
MKKKALLRNTLFVTVVILSTSAMFAQLDTALFSGMKARSIGPAGMSGRIAAIDAVVSNPEIIYAGAATGGIFKSTNAGMSWKPLFDQQPVAAIGALAIYQVNPSIIWAGTGEGNPRNSASVGNGIYKSIDAGDTWTHMGLDFTERIHRIITHPGDPNIVYAAAMGRMWGENPERGVFKTADGGKTWKKIFYVNEKTGCAELVIDPLNPNKLFAAMWEYRRWPWFFKSGGPGSGLFVTYDGGENWKRLTEKEGLPPGELGRIGIAVSKNVPDVVYALIESKKNALYRSDDGGRTWDMINNSSNVAPRPFYYAEIYLDPRNENRLYNLHSGLQVSNDGGKSFSTIANRIHSDHHALWLHPGDGDLLIDGNDGGIAISRDQGRSWQFVENLPLGQFYHISVDMEVPYNVYGGMQDNGSWRGPSDVWENGGIRNWHWNEVGFGDGFAVLVDASNPSFGYSMSQGGGLIRFNTKTGERKDIRPWGPRGIKLRFNWNAAIAQDPFDPQTIYYGSQFVHMSTNRGNDWVMISPDLTTNDSTKQKQNESGGLTLDVTAAENHTTIVTIAPSPVQRGIIWIGTDDGNVQVTQDGGKTWNNVIEKIPDVPKNTWVPHIEASKYDAGTAYVVFDDHRRSNWKTYLVKTTDFGKSWSSLTKNDPTISSRNKKEQWGYGLVVEQDPVNKQLLYFGTEFGLWISTDDGKNWMKWTNGFPTVSTMALMVHPRDNDLVIGTHGRSAYILDDVKPLQLSSKETFEKPLHLFKISKTVLHQTKQVDGYHFPGDAMFRGETKSYGAMINFSVNPSQDMVTGGTMRSPGRAGESEESDTTTMTRGRDSIRARIEVADLNGKLVRNFDAPVKKGINRVVWNLRMNGVRSQRGGQGGRGGAAAGGQAAGRVGGTRGGGGGEGFTPAGPEVPAGTYIVKIKIGKYEASDTVEVIPDPRTNYSVEAHKKQIEMIQNIGQRTEILSEVSNRISTIQRVIDAVIEQVRDQRSAAARELTPAANELKRKVQAVSDLFTDNPVRDQGTVRSQTTVSSLINGVMRSLTTSYEAPSTTHEINLKQAEAKMEEALKKFNQLFAEDVPAFRQKVEAAKLSLFQEYEPLDMNWKPRRREQ